MSRVCVLTSLGDSADNRAHRHVSRKVAEQMAGTSLGEHPDEQVFEAHWTSDKQEAILLEPTAPWRWQPKRSGPAGPTVLQLLR